MKVALVVLIVLFGPALGIWAAERDMRAGWTCILFEGGHHGHIKNCRMCKELGLTPGNRAEAQGEDAE